ncbi:DUF4123 domain-containing protein [Ideonella azotifigens]|uniref:DUF4123 domain-containing protein n=1 Tax=Ideonella azotifigens TaxID=513160 RepID=A0ABN1KIR3_9BURK|nr:DUF4123 domain-containing protein [Ideonella azotifigens]MCD2339614.1 DUF4123 domain-containing protein [Ideonella azotifigens]
MTVDLPVLDHRVLLAQDFALLNPSDVDEPMWIALEAQPLGTEQFECDARLLPRLACLRDIPLALRLECLDLAEARMAQQLPPLFGALLETSESFASLKARLGRQLLLRLERSSRSYFFRYPDPRVFQHLPRIFTDQQLDGFIWPARAWTWFDGLARTWRRRSVANRPATGLRPVLSLAQIDALARLDLLNRTALKLQADELLPAPPSPESLDQLDDLVRRAIVDEALADPDDQIQYAVNAVKFGADVHDVEAVRRLLGQVRAGEQSYLAGMQELADAGQLAPLTTRG